ncbi:MAG TPA: Clp protease N-terminal domain-containing protein [Acidimicrobiales bacterium]|nr:Clp protease N-terminal domain-containing protein [Acidimicrobiales bacterium]
MPKLSVYVPDELAAAVRDAQVPVSAVCQAALERAVREVAAARGADETPPDDSAAAVGLFGRFTPRARQAVVLAQEEARAIPHGYIGTEHVLLGVLAEGDNVANRTLAAMEVDPADLRAEILASLLPPSPAPAGHIPFTPRAKGALERSTREALGLGHNYIGTEHLLLGLLAMEEGLASRVMRRMGLELRTTRMTVVQTLLQLSTPPPGIPVPASRTPTEPAPDALAEILARLEAIERRLGESGD